ncbi:hypothetical protein F4861DRAFT_551861 [Xylaria intraflava]|nr:hypothetical protein F4861DRAFT_551861 [Xylaria intraflava]
MDLDEYGRRRRDRAWENLVWYKNETWRNYRVSGQSLVRSPEEIADIIRRNAENRPQPPNPRDPLMFFENHRWEPSIYQNYGDGEAISRATDFDPVLAPESAEAQARYREVLGYFDKPRYVVQSVLGYGGQGLATHFKDCGPDGTEQPGRDFVVKVSLSGWQSNAILREKEMMRKVGDSAHCVQAIKPRDVGKTEERARLPPLHSDDSSVDTDSSGNDSLDSIEIRRRYRIQKRERRPKRYYDLKLQRYIKRQNDLLEQENSRPENDEPKDYILMEYLQHGNLATLIRKLQNAKPEDEHLVQIPNRVLWGFWLCLIRACIAMEYPPRKFHPRRRKTEQTPRNAVPYLAAKANHMLQECKSLAIRIFDVDQTSAPNQSGESDLIESLPSAPTSRRLRSRQNWNLERRQNMVHHDIDPTNIFVNGFELDEEGLQGWQETRQKMQAESGNPIESVEDPPHTKKQFGRIPGEHELVPRLKLADFGSALCVKQQKRNVYYYSQRGAGKIGDYPPEDFGPEWERIPADRDGSHLANSRTCGFYSNKTNIWGVALTMWQLITGHEAPIPPNPQPPYDEVDRYPPYNEEGQTNMDKALQDRRYKGFKISYCPLLMDPRVSDYDWVDRKLRKTIFECMYHKPDDRPSLAKLLAEAEERLQAEFPGETDDKIREWVQHWFFDCIDTPSESDHNSHSDLALEAVGDDIDQDQLALQMENDGVGNAHRMQLEIQMNADFLYGWERVTNSEPQLRCGLRAVVDSFQHQLGPSPTINGVTYDLSNSLPAMEDLLDIHASLNDTLVAFGLEGEANMNVTVLGLIVHEWGIRNGIDLELAYKLEGRQLPLSTTNHHDNPKYLWIWNDNARDLAILNGDAMIPLYNHYEGLRPLLPPIDSDSDTDDLAGNSGLAPVSNLSSSPVSEES